MQGEGLPLANPRYYRLEKRNPALTRLNTSPVLRACCGCGGVRVISTTRSHGETRSVASNLFPGHAGRCSTSPSHVLLRVRAVHGPNGCGGVDTRSLTGTRFGRGRGAGWLVTFGTRAPSHPAYPPVAQSVSATRS